MAIGTVAGTTIGISASKPSSFTTIGYNAIAFTTIGNVEDAGEHGRIYDEVVFETLNSDGVRKYKSTYTESKKTLVIGYDGLDAGIALLRQALSSKSDYYFAVAYPSGDIDFFSAKVLKLTKTIGSVDSIRRVSAELTLTTNNNVGVVEYIKTNLALESGFDLLQENGSLILLEQ